MKRINKYISLTLLLITAALAVGCNKEPDPTPSDGRYVIAFDEVTVDTKAPITATDGISKFKVWGAVKENADDAVYNNIFEGATVEWGENSEGENAWNYSGEQYWQENSSYRFFAVSPISHSVNYDKDLMTYSVDYVTPNQFNVPDADFEDLVVATQTVDTPATFSTDPASVDLTFKHPITKVNLHIAKSSENKDDKMVVTEVSMKGMKNSGAYTYYLETGLAEWNFKSTTSSLTYNGEYEVKVDETIVNEETEETEEGWLKLQFYSLPHYISDNAVSLQITYKYKEASVTDFNTKSYDVYLPQTDVWKENNIVTYKVELSADHKIRFYISKVDTWGLMPSGTVIIQ